MRVERFEWNVLLEALRVPLPSRALESMQVLLGHCREEAVMLQNRYVVP